VADSDEEQGKEGISILEVVRMGKVMTGMPLWSWLMGLLTQRRRAGKKHCCVDTLHVDGSCRSVEKSIMTQETGTYCMEKGVVCCLNKAVFWIGYTGNDVKYTMSLYERLNKLTKMMKPRVKSNLARKGRRLQNRPQTKGQTKKDEKQNRRKAKSPERRNALAS